MNENGQEQNLQEVIDTIKYHPKHKPYWKRIHHTWWFWVGVIMMFTAILYYVVSVDFAFAPRKQTKQQTERTTTPQISDLTTF